MLRIRVPAGKCKPERPGLKTFGVPPYPWRCIHHLDSLVVHWHTKFITNKMEVCCLGNGIPSLPLLSNISPCLTLCQSPHNRTRTKDLGCIPRIHGYVFAARITGKVGYLCECLASSSSFPTRPLQCVSLTDPSGLSGKLVMPRVEQALKGECGKLTR